MEKQNRKFIIEENLLSATINLIAEGSFASVNFKQVNAIINDLQKLPEKKCCKKETKKKDKK